MVLEPEGRYARPFFGANYPPSGTGVSERYSAIHARVMPLNPRTVTKPRSAEGSTCHLALQIGRFNGSLKVSSLT